MSASDLERVADEPEPEVFTVPPEVAVRIEILSKLEAESIARKQVAEREITAIGGQMVEILTAVTGLPMNVLNEKRVLIDTKAKTVTVSSEKGAGDAGG